MKKSDVTYGQLESAFQELGFKAIYGEYPKGVNYVRYESGQDDTIVVLKSLGIDELVDAIDILSAQITLDGRGVIDREGFTRLLRRHTPEAMKAA